MEWNTKVICKLDIENDYDHVKCECLMYDWEVWLWWEMESVLCFYCQISLAVNGFLGGEMVRSLNGLNSLFIDLSMCVWGHYLFGCLWMAIVHLICWIFWISCIVDCNLRVYFSTEPVYLSSSFRVLVKII